MKRKQWIFILLSAVAVFPALTLNSCDSSGGLSSRHAAYLKGTWNMSGAIDSVHAWYLEYTFGDGVFSMTGCPPISKKGYFKLKDQKEEEYLLSLSGLTGNPPPPDTASMRLVIERKAMTLYIDGQGPFHKNK